MWTVTFYNDPLLITVTLLRALKTTKWGLEYACRKSNIHHLQCWAAIGVHPVFFPSDLISLSILLFFSKHSVFWTVFILWGCMDRRNSFSIKVVWFLLESCSRGWLWFGPNSRFPDSCKDEHLTNCLSVAQLALLFEFAIHPSRKKLNLSVTACSR